MPSSKDYEHLITRNLDLTKARDLALLEWFWMVLIPKACGCATIWNKAKLEHMCLSTAAPNDDPNRPHVTSETEAYAIMVAKSNDMRWRKQFQVANDHRCAS